MNTPSEAPEQPRAEIVAESLENYRQGRWQTPAEIIAELHGATTDRRNAGSARASRGERQCSPSKPQPLGGPVCNPAAPSRNDTGKRKNRLRALLRDLAGG